MKLTHLKISNYRNLCGEEIYFNSSNNFIVGENNLGKTNILTLLNIIFKNTYRTGFQEEDFSDSEKPIEVIFSLELDDLEVGLFEDLFDSEEDENKITIKALQENVDEYLEYWHQETNLKISPSTIKCVNFLYYDSQRDPNKELTFDKGKGVGRFLNHLVKKHISENEEAELDFIDPTKTADVLQDINSQLSKIKAFKDYQINAKLEENIEDLVAKLFLLKDGENRGLNQSGYGVQFLVVISLFILDKLLNLGKIKSKKGIFEKENKKAISLIIGLDEPEIHLHPYLQRSLIKSIQDILQNKDLQFSEILKKAFDIDLFLGQAIVATHSPSILLQDYTEIIRLYKIGDKLKIKCGSKINLHHGLKKQMKIQFPYIREAFFSRAALIVEGDSEYSSFPYFAKTIDPNYDFDQLGIAIIRVGGEKSVKPTLQLMQEFMIPAIGIIDKDQGNTGSANLRITTERDFECELLKLIDNSKTEVLKSIVEEYDNLKLERNLKKESLEKYQLKYPLVLNQALALNNTKLIDIPDSEIDLLKIWYMTWLNINKNILSGGTIGTILSVEDIPTCYKDVIMEIVNLSKS